MKCIFFTSCVWIKSCLKPVPTIPLGLTALMFQSHRVQSPVRGTHTVSYFLFLRERTWLLACIWFQMSQKAQLGNTGLPVACHFYTFLQGPVYGLTVSGKHLAALKEETHNR